MKQAFVSKTGNDISGEWLFGKKLADVAETTDTFSMFHLKESMDQIKIRKPEKLFLM